MQGIKLKDFQINTVNKLLDATSIGSKKEVLLQAPTGSGKTIILLFLIIILILLCGIVLLTQEV